MRMLIVFLFLVLLGLIPDVTGGQGRPIPPGIREADKQTNKPLDPPLSSAPRLDSARLKQQADELALLSAGVPSDIATVSRGQIPKDLADKLKRIEKLARNLRNQLTP